MTTQQETQTLDETLNKTDLGHMINENKKPIIIGGILLIIAVLIFSVVDHQSSKKKLEDLDKVFKVQETVFSAYVKGESDSETFKKSLQGVQNEFIANPNLVPAFMEALNTLESKGKMDNDFVGIAQNWLGKLNKQGPLYLFLGLRVVSLLEDANKSTEAIAILENLSNNKSTLLRDKIKFELARIYHHTGKADQAKPIFEQVTKEYPESEYAKLAKFYLNGL